jgi:hypothetical protein
MTAFNEADVIVPVVRHLVEQGIRVHLIDSWSTDGTQELVRQSFDESLVGIERFPPDQPCQVYDWTRLLRRVDAVGAASQADWIVHHDADEIRQSPWSSLNLRDAFYLVDQTGFNCVDHTVLQFRPVGGEQSFPDPSASMRWFEWGTRPGHFHQLKAWRRQPGGVCLAAYGGHEASFPGRRVFPYKFLLRHYPIRSQEHGERKVLAERQPRWHAAERAAGWHTQYDQYDVDSSFVWEQEKLHLWDSATFCEQWLVQRISGVGIPRDGHAASARPSDLPEASV